MPEPTLRRLPIYDHSPQTVAAAGVTRVSTTGIAGPLQLDPTQVRRDLEATGMIGKPQFGIHSGAAFDNDPVRIGLSIARTEVLPLDRLVEFCRGMNIKPGVMITSWDSAQSVADSLVEGGIRAIWNFAPMHLQVPQSVLIQNEDLYRSPTPLPFRLERRVAAERDSSMMGPIAGPGPNEDSPALCWRRPSEDSYAEKH
jgi:redox-sensing transcriptional repressor